MKGKYKIRSKGSLLKKQKTETITPNKSEFPQTRALREDEQVPAKLPSKKEKRFLSRIFLPLVGVVSVLILVFGFLAFAPLDTKEQQKITHESFSVALFQSFSPVGGAVPTGRVVIFKNASGYPTIRVVVINDYSLDKIEGRCIHYSYVWTETKQKECTLLPPRKEEPIIAE